MVLSISLLFFSAIFGGILFYLIPNQKGDGFPLSLTFAGAYLFSITIIHLIPGIYSRYPNTLSIGIFMLVGFFFQQVLEYFSSGIEHGHYHQKAEFHQHSNIGILSVLLALSVHSFLEGGMLANPSTMNTQNWNYTLLAGILVHKIPAAYALMSLVCCKTRKWSFIIGILLIFSIASPAGLFLSHYSNTNNLISEKTSLILYSIVCGSFLQISTTIAFESSPQHKFDLKKFGVALAGAITAIASELL